jgi:hypothetical protein
MHSPFDILMKNPEGSFRMFEVAKDLESANVRIKQLLALSPGEYVVLHQRTHCDRAPSRSSSRSMPEESERYGQAHVFVELSRHGIARPRHQPRSDAPQLGGQISLGLDLWF